MLTREVVARKIVTFMVQSENLCDYPERNLNRKRAYRLEKDALPLPFSSFDDTADFSFTNSFPIVRRLTSAIALRS